MNDFQIYLQGAASVKYELLYYLTNFVSSISVKELTDKAAVFSEIKNCKVEISDLINQEEKAV